MKIRTLIKTLKDIEFFILFSLFWVGLGWLGVILALLGAFYLPIILLYLLGGIFILWYRLSSNPLKFTFQAHFTNMSVILCSLVIIFILSFHTAPTIFSGRDQGSISEAAIRLSQNHKLPFSFEAEKELFNIYGKGLALHFPGFAYTQQGELISQFPAGYISWLGIFYSILGLPGLVVANGISSFIFILSFYFLCRNYLRAPQSIAATACAITSFTFSWFFKFTLSENFALALVWLGIYSLSSLILTRKKIYLISFLLSFGLLLFVRIEAVAFLAMGIGVLAYYYRNNLWKLAGKETVILLGIIFIIYAVSALANIFPFLIPIKGLLKPLLFNDSQPSLSPSFFNPFLYILKMFSAYYILPFFALGTFGIGTFIYKRKFDLLVPFLVLSPAFFYLFSPHISSDHPWALRRFAFSVIPLSIFYAILFLNWIFKKKVFFFIALAILIFLNLNISLRYIFISPHQNLLPQIKSISQNFKPQDLVLIDAKATGDNWSMMTGPLNFMYGIQAVYFINPNDLAKINLNLFNAVYFIIPDNNLEAYAKNGLLKTLSPIREYQIQNEILDARALNKQTAYRSKIKLPEKKTIETHGMIYLYNKK